MLYFIINFSFIILPFLFVGNWKACMFFVNFGHHYNKSITDSVFLLILSINLYVSLSPEASKRLG